MAIIEKCTCKHAQQDAINGEKMRVMNETMAKAQDKHAIFRCTVCGSTKEFKK